MRPRPTIRLRMTVLYAGLFLAAGTLLLGVSYGLLDRHFHRTLPDSVAADVLAQLRSQYLLALLAVTAIAVLLGWLAAGRALRPLRSIVAAARTVSGESLDRRIRPDGPDDELRELAETFDDMLGRLEAAFASQRRFVANASHELRTPLTVLRTEVEVALADPDASTEELRATAEIVRDEVRRSEALIDSLLALARSEAGAVARDDPVELDDVARSAVQEVEGLAAERGISVTVRAESALVRGDRRLLEQLLRNLAENAVAHNHEGGFARISVRADGPQVRIGVENSGPRIPAEVAPSLLEPFERLGRKRHGGAGAGVGLSIVRAVAQAHGGGVDLAARPGGGLAVEVYLPAEAWSATTGPDGGRPGDRAPGNRRTAARAPHRRTRAPGMPAGGRSARQRR
jgi:signal transduction histidine kinase